MNFDFVAMNLTGFLFYSIYSSYGYFVSDTQTGQVELNDVLFGYHALFATFICITQILLFPSGKNKIHWYTVTLLFFMWAFILIYSTLTLVRTFLFLEIQCCSRYKLWSFSLYGIFQISHFHAEVLATNVLELWA